jgi:hypothetical protein
MNRRLSLALCLVVGLGCASTRETIDVSPLDVPGPGVRPSSGDEQIPVTEREPEDTSPAVLTRDVLANAVTRGFGSFLGRIAVTPVIDAGGRFQGFRLDRARDLRRWNAAGLDLRAGDIVTRINGRSIERPEMAMSVFSGMRDVTEVQVDVIRGGAPLSVHLAVQGTAPVGASTPPAPAAPTAPTAAATVTTTASR